MLGGDAEDDDRTPGPRPRPRSARPTASPATPGRVPAPHRASRRDRVTGGGGAVLPARRRAASRSPTRSRRCARAARSPGAVLTFRDVSERRRFERQLRHFADHDPLTDLFNRRRFEEEMDQPHRADRAPWRQRRGAPVRHRQLQVRQRHARPSGRRRDPAQGRRPASRPPARDGLRSPGSAADEFAVLLADTPQRRGRERRARARRGRSATQNFLFDGRSIRVTASVGVDARSRGGDLTAEELMVRADLAMFQAKEAGRDRVGVYSTELADATRERIGLTWVERIRRALEEDRMVLFGQPIYDLAEKRVSQIELLLRMRGEDGELIPPGSFLPTAERFGLIQQIDSWVVRAGDPPARAQGCRPGRGVAARGQPLRDLGRRPRAAEADRGRARRAVDRSRRTSSSRSPRPPRSPRWTRRARSPSR